MLPQKDLNIIIDTLRPYNPKRIGLFGSIARNEETPESDVDILFLLKNPVGLFTLSKIKDTLEYNLKRKVDLISENGLNIYIKDSVLNEVKYIYEN